MADKATFTILSSAARTATPTISSITSTTSGAETQSMTDLQITIDVTAVTATPSVQPALEGFDATSGKWFDLIASITAITATGTTTIKYGENAAVVANNANQGFIPKTFRLTMTHADADSITYSVGMNLQTK
jgi:hypothetical protein